MALWFLWFLFHVEDSIVGIKFYNTGALELFDGRLIVTHDARRVFLVCKLHEFCKREEKEIVGCYDEEVVIYIEFVHCEEKIADGTKTGIVGFCSIVNYGNGLGVFQVLCPFLEDVGELMVGDDDVLIYLWYLVDIIKHTTEDGALPYLEEWLWEVLCQFAKASGIASGNNYIFHWEAGD